MINNQLSDESFFDNFSDIRINKKEFIIEYEIGHWEFPFTIQKGDTLKWDSELMKIVGNEITLESYPISIKVIDILQVEIGYEMCDAILLVKSILD